MASAPLTPEDKLLRLIENPAKARANIFGGKLGVKSVNLKGIFSKFQLKKDFFSLDFITKGLVGFAVILTMAIIWQVFAIRGDFIKKDWELSVIGRKDMEVKSVPLLPLSDYQREFAIMSMFSGVSEVTAQVVQAQVQEDITSQLKNLKLVGIIWSDNPQAMIESVAEGKTLLVNIGDQIEKIKVKNIYKDRVVLGVDTQEWELR